MIDERVRGRIARVIAHELGLEGLDVEGELDVQLYHRWDRHVAKLVVEGYVRETGS